MTLPPAFVQPAARILAIAVLALAATRHTPAAVSTNPPPAAAWDAVGRVTASGGYRDNILRTRIAPESSAFETIAADFSLMRLSERESYLALFLLGEDTRYLESRSMPKEQLFSGVAQGQLPVGPRDSIGLETQYFYQHGVVDASEAEFALRRVVVDGHGFGLRPNWRHEWHPRWITQIDGIMQRQLYGAELDDYWEGGGRLRLIHPYGNRSEWSLGFLSNHRLYDTRLRLDPDFAPMPGAGLVYRQSEVDTRWRHFLDSQRRWRLSTRVGVLLSRDNGTGFFDYDRLLASQSLRWRDRGWEITGGARFSGYRYPNQNLAGDPRYRSTVALDLRIERRLGRNLFLHAAAEREWNLSNDPLDRYRDWMAAAGIGAEF